MLRRLFLAKDCRRTALIALLMLVPACLNAQVVNGDFSLGTNDWRLVFPPGNVQFPNYGVVQFDIDGPGPLPTSPAFFVQPGDDALLNLEQDLPLLAGVTYIFHADLAMVAQSLNGDGGTVSAFIGQTALASYSFGMVTNVGQIDYGSISTNYTPSASGPQTLSIHFSRGGGFAYYTPADYIDNISFSPVRIPLVLQHKGSALILTWTNATFALQTSAVLNGIYTNVPGAVSPYTNTIPGQQVYFRLKAG